MENMPDKLDYRYFAFISYSSKDKKIAEKIHQRITNFPLPSVLRNELEAANGREIPQSVSPLFLDITNLPAGQLLGETILQELNDSRFLLVICSPNSAKSDWVNQEVENFILMGRYDRIIPYIIKGTPNSNNPKTECFPPILRQKRSFITYPILSNEENAERHAKLHAFLDSIHDELRGVSLSAEGSENSLMKIIARMLEIRPDVFIDLYAKQQKQKKEQHKKIKVPWLSIFATFFLILCSILGYRTWDRAQTHVGYFADYVEYWGVPKGIFPLTPAQCAHREGHYRIYTKNLQVMRLEHVNSAGIPVPVTNTELKDRPMIAEYPLYENGRLVRRNNLDNNGNVVMSHLYSGDNMQKVEFKSMASDNTSSSAVLTNVTSITNSLLDPFQRGGRGEIGNMRLIRDSKGRVIEERFQKGTYDVPTTDEQGISGFRYTLDDLGRVVEKIYLDQNGAPCPDKQGVARRTNQYDEHGYLVEAKYFDVNGNLTPNELGWMHCINTYDKFGNPIKTEFFDASGDLCLNNNGVAGWNIKYNELGNAIEIAYFGLDDKPCLHNGGYAKVTKEYDERGNKIEEDYFGVDSKPCLCNEGYAIITKKYDERGNIIEEAYFGVDGKPCLRVDGIAKVTWEFDKRGNATEIAYFGVDDLPCLSKQKLAKFTKKYDERGNKIEEDYFGVDSKPCLCDEGYAIFTKKYDERGNIIEIAYFDVDGKPCLSNDGYAKITIKYDERGNIIEIAYFDVDGKPCLSNDGYAIFTKKYDERGNIIEIAYFGVDGKPCLHKKGYAKVIFIFDEDRQVIEAKYFDIDGQPCLSDENIFKTTWKYDKRGKVLEQAFFGIDGLPCPLKDGYAKIAWEYDEQGNETKVTFYDIHGKELPYYIFANDVSPDSNGEKFGIKDGDIFILYDGQPVENHLTLIEKRSKETGDDPHELVVLRDKEFIAIQIYPGQLGCTLSMKAISEDQQKLVTEKLKEVKKD